MSAKVTLSSNIDPVAADLRRIGAGVVDLDDTNRDAARLLLRGVTPPRLSGRLAAAGRADVEAGGFLISYPVRYSTFVHWGAPRIHVRAQPWLLRSATAELPAVEAVYADHVRDTINANT